MEQGDNCKMLILNSMVNYNKNSDIYFKSKTNYEKIYKEMEKITVRQEEKILPKIKKSGKTFSKINFPKFKLPKIKKRMTNFLFKYDLIPPINVKYSHDYQNAYYDPNQIFCLKEYANNAYKKYRASSVFGLILLEEKRPDGVRRIYNDSKDLHFVMEEYFPNGAEKIYKMRPNFFSPTYLWGERLADGTKKLYSEDGKIVKVYPKTDMRSLKQI